MPEDLFDDIGDEYDASVVEEAPQDEPQETPVERQPEPDAAEPVEQEVTEESPEQEFELPDWIESSGFVDSDERAPRQEYYQQQPPPQQYPPHQMPPQYPNQPWQQNPQQQQNQYANQQILERFVENPQQVLSEMIEAGVSQRMRALEGGVNSVAAEVERSRAAQAKSVENDIRNSLKDNYKKVFSKDAMFMGNERVRNRAQSWVKEQAKLAAVEARMGNTERAAMFFDPNFAAGVVALAKIVEGYPADSGIGIKPSASAQPAGTSAGKEKKRPQIDPDTENALRRYGSGYLDRYADALAKVEKYKDIEFE